MPTMTLRCCIALTVSSIIFCCPAFGQQEMERPSIADVYTDRARYAPHESVKIFVEWRNGASNAGRAAVKVDFWHLGERVGEEITMPVDLSAGRGPIALDWTPPPTGTVELVLIVQDPDVPFGKPATHALTLGIDPELAGLPENALANPSPMTGLRHGKGPLGRRGWAGPLPIRSHGPHSYVFQLFALDQVPGLPAVFTLDDVMAAIQGHVIGRARLDGSYEIR